MSQTPTDLWGQDIALDSAGQARVAANGELVLTSGPETGVQDIRLRLFTRLESLFYDTGFGSLLYDWVLEESTESTRAALCAEVVMRVEADPRVVPHSVTASVLKWDERTVMVSVFWHFLSEDQPFNLVMQLDKATQELLVNDAAPHQDSFSPPVTDD